MIAAQMVEPEDQAEFLARVERAQAEFVDLKPFPKLASDELTAERRLDAWREDVETNGWLRDHASTPLQR